MTISNFRSLRVLFFACALSACFVTLAHSASLNIGPGELITPMMPFGTWGANIDGSFATLKRDANKSYFWHTRANETWKYYGPPDNPLQTLVWKKNISQLWPTWSMPSPSYPWLCNIYKIDSTHLLGFVHREYNYVGPVSGEGNQYAHGLGYSSNGGDTWTYLGDVFQPQNTYGNPAGMPYVVVGSYFYQYFCEYDPNHPDTGIGVSIVRAPVAEVVAAAQQGRTSTWVKYSGGGLWNTNAFTGLGANVFPDLPGCPATNFNACGDAAYCPALNKYVFVGSRPFILFSDDGVNWPAADVISIPGMDQYPALASLDPGASDDSHVVGANFDLYYGRWNSYSVTCDELWRQRLSVSGGLPSPSPAPAPVPAPIPTAQFSIGASVIVINDAHNVRSGPDGNLTPIAVVQQGTTGVIIGGPSNGFYQVDWNDSTPTGWIVANWLAATAPAPAPAPVPTIYSTTYSASHDFSGAQGSRGWTYLDSAGRALAFDAASAVWKGNEPYLWLWSNGGHPGTSLDTIRRWTAPQGGTITITGTISDSDNGGGDGVTGIIWKNGVEVRRTAITNGGSASYSVSTSVIAGDKIDFVLNRNGNSYWDSTNFDPTIVLNSSVPTSSG